MVYCSRKCTKDKTCEIFAGIIFVHFLLFERRIRTCTLRHLPLLVFSAHPVVVDSLFIVAPIVCGSFMFDPCFVIQSFVSF